MISCSPKTGALTVAVVAFAMAACGGCRREAPPERSKAANSGATLSAETFSRQAIGQPFEGRPWITHVTTADLDGDGLLDILACDAQKNSVVWLRQTARGEFAESVLASDLPAPVHVACADVDGDGDGDLLVACMGQVFPTNDKIGSVVVLENDGGQRFSARVLLEGVARVTDVQAGDFNRDGRLDLAVAQFGYDQGEIRWMENLGDWKFKSHRLLELSGAINVLVADMTGDGSPDIVSVVSQQWEEIYLFTNDGYGAFKAKVIFGSTNEDYGSSGISLCDLNGDGRLDILYTNGDGFDYAQPGSRPWHGVQWLENKWNGFFAYHRIGDLPGAYSPVGADLDGDGHIDVIAVSGFNDWSNLRAVSLMGFRNDGRQGFAPCPLAHEPTHLITAAAGDLDGNGRPVIVTGGFHAYPPWDRMSRIVVWRRR